MAILDYGMCYDSNSGLMPCWSGLKVGLMFEQWRRLYCYLNRSLAWKSILTKACYLRLVSMILGFMRRLRLWGVIMVFLLLCIWGCLLVEILWRFSFGIRWLIGSVVACLDGSVKIYHWMVGWFCLSPFCLLFQFIFFLSSKLPQVLFLPFILSFAILGKSLGLNGTLFVYKRRMEV